MSPRRSRAGWLVALVAIAAACGGAPEPEAKDSCIPNQAISCTCAGGELGVQECAADGSGYGACIGCQGTIEGCTNEPDCDGCSSCFDSCVCQGGDAKACLKQCAGGSAGSSGSGGSSGSPGGGGYSGGGSSGGGSGGYSGGGSSGSGGWSGGGSGGGGGGALDCQGCVAQSCPGELAGCTQTSGCIELVQCAQSSGCSLSDYGCLLFGCGAYMINFKAVPAAMSLGGCASQACSVECS